VPEEETFVRRIEELSRSAGEPIETINSAVPGIGLESELAILLETGVETEPDVVVLCFYLNDALPSPGVRILPVPRVLEWSRLRSVRREVGRALQGSARCRPRQP